MTQAVGKIGGPGAIRTPDPQIRRLEPARISNCFSKNYPPSVEGPAGKHPGFDEIRHFNHTHLERVKMKLTTIATILALTAVPAFAGGNNNQNGPQGGNSSATSSATAIAGASATGGTAIAQGGAGGRGGDGGHAIQGQGQVQGQTASNSINVEGTAVAPGVSCPFGFSFGTVGASAGVCIPTRTGNAVSVANAYTAAGRPDLAVTILNATPASQRAFSIANKAANEPRPSTSGLPYTRCEAGARGFVTVPAPGVPQAQAVAACRAALR